VLAKSGEVKETGSGTTCTVAFFRDDSVLEMRVVGERVRWYGEDERRGG
jgi:hypothetical protein